MPLSNPIHEYFAAQGIDLTLGANEYVMGLDNTGALKRYAVSAFGQAGIETPEGHGAAGDGVTDDTVAFQAAIDAAISGRKRLVLSPVSYRITAQILANDAEILIIDANGAELFLDFFGNGGYGKFSISATTLANAEGPDGIIGTPDDKGAYYVINGLLRLRGCYLVGDTQPRFNTIADDGTGVLRSGGGNATYGRRRFVKGQYISGTGHVYRLYEYATAGTTGDQPIYSTGSGIGLHGGAGGQATANYVTTLNWREQWLTATAYAANDLAVGFQHVWRCRAGGTSVQKPTGASGVNDREITVESRYQTGTITISGTSVTLSGGSTATWVVGDYIVPDGETVWGTIASIDSGTTATLTTSWAGGAVSAKAYKTGPVVWEHLGERSHWGDDLIVAMRSSNVYIDKLHASYCGDTCFRHVASTLDDPESGDVNYSADISRSILVNHFVLGAHIEAANSSTKGGATGVHFNKVEGTLWRSFKIAQQVNRYNRSSFYVSLEHFGDYYAAVELQSIQGIDGVINIKGTPGVSYSGVFCRVNQHVNQPFNNLRLDVTAVGFESPFVFLTSEDGYEIANIDLNILAEQYVYGLTVQGSSGTTSGLNRCRINVTGYNPQSTAYTHNFNNSPYFKNCFIDLRNVAYTADAYNNSNLQDIDIANSTRNQILIPVAAAPTAPGTGDHMAGTILENVNPGAGQVAELVCTTAGTPGTWKARTTVAA